MGDTVNIDDAGGPVTNQTSTPRPVPPLVQEMVDGMHEATGIRPEVETLSSRRWRVKVSSERVVATAEFKHSPSGRVRWDDGALTVDGVSRPTAETYRELARIFADPDGHMAPKVTSLPPMPPVIPVHQAPAQVQHFYHLVAGRLSGEGMGEVELGHEGNVWVIALESDKGTLRLYVRRAKTRRSGFAYKPSLQLFVDGVDYSAQLNGNIGLAMAMLMGDAPAEPSSGPAPISSPARPARSNSVEVRRATVIRT